jgi:hypothetical protein
VKFLVPALLGCLMMGGCADLISKDCHSDYAIGLGDGLTGTLPRAAVYGSRCARYGVQPDAARYLEGWRDGYGEIHLRLKGA